MTDTVHNVRSQVLMDAHIKSNGMQNLQDILRSRPFTSKKAILKATNLLLWFESWAYPKQVIELYIDLKREKFVLEHDLTNLDYHTGFSAPFVDAALTCSAAIMKGLKRKLDKSVIERITNITPKQKRSKKSIAFLKELPQEEIDEEIEHMIKIQSHKTRQSIGLTLVFLTLWINDVHSKHFNSYFLNIKNRGFHENNAKIVETCKFNTDFASTPFVQKCITALNRRILDYINKTSETEYRSIAVFLIDALNGSASLKEPNHWVEYEVLDDCYEYYHISGETKSLTPEYIEETVQSVFICYIQTCLEIVTNPAPIGQHPKLKPFDISNVLNRNKIDLQDTFLFLNALDEQVVLNSCAWMLKSRHVRDINIDMIRETISVIAQSRTDEVQTIKPDNKTVKKLQRKIQEMEKECTHQSSVISTLRAENAQLKKQKSIPNPESDPEKLELRRRNNKAAKQLSKLQSELEHERDKISALEEKIALLSQQSSQSNEFSIDLNKKYLFVVDDDRMCARLKAWFPNIVISDHAEISLRNASCFYMCVIMTTKVSHVVYKHYKNKCIQYNIPVANCNGTNYQAICASIHQCEKENGFVSA